MSAQRVGLRELKQHLGAYIRRVKAGERIIVTDRNRVVAAVVPPGSEEAAGDLLALVRDGVATWKGGKPRGLSSPPTIEGKSVAQAVLEDRR